MEVKISRDIRTYKQRDIGPFTFKEFGWIVLGIGAGVLTWYISKSVEIAIAPMLLILVFGFFKPCKMTTWQFLKTVGRDTLTPRVYVWESATEGTSEEDEELRECILQTAQPLAAAPCEITKEERASLFK